LEIGELQRVLIELSQKDYAIPGTDRCRVGVKTLEAWYYRWRRDGIEGLAPKSRADQGLSKLSEEVQDLILKTRRENPRRSLNQIRHLLESTGQVPRGVISQSALHRFLKQQGLSRMQGASPLPEEHRSFVAQEANGIWYGDVMHGPRVRIKNQIHKGYLVSLMDDASRLITHSAFCPGETALDVEGVLKQAVLKRGLPRKLVVDQGAAYRSKTLQGICARLSIHLVYCRPYAPEGKGKIERWHRTLREQFLREIDPREVLAIEDLNARLWVWLAQVYHVRAHGGLNDQTPLERYQQDLPKIRQLGLLAPRIDEIFYHRVTRNVRKDGTVSYLGQCFEVPYELSRQKILLVVDPHAGKVIGVEDAEGKSVGVATPIDRIANVHRRRRRTDERED
jgi:transposase InsO family protein